jgi:hypothetical protein
VAIILVRIDVHFIDMDFVSLKKERGSIFIDRAAESGLLKRTHSTPGIEARCRAANGRQRVQSLYRGDKAVRP